MAYQEVKHTLKEWLEKISVSRRNLGLANRVVRSCIASERMADLDQDVTTLHTADDTINVLLPGLDELLDNAEAALFDHDTGLAYKYLISPDRPFDYEYATWVETTGTMVFTARDNAREIVEAFGSVVVGGSPDKVHVFWINAYGFKNYFQTWTHDLGAPSGVWGDIYVVVDSASASTLGLDLIDWDANEDLIATNNANFSSATEWTLVNFTIDTGVGNLILAASTLGWATWETLTSLDSPTFRHNHVYEVTYQFDVNTVFASGLAWFRFELGDTIGPKITEESLASEILTQNILATQPIDGSDINLVIRGDMDAGDNLALEFIQISEVIPDSLDVNVELAWRDF